LVEVRTLACDEQVTRTLLTRQGDSFHWESRRELYTLFHYRNKM